MHFLCPRSHFEDGGEMHRTGHWMTTFIFQGKLESPPHLTGICLWNVNRKPTQTVKEERKTPPSKDKRTNLDSSCCMKTTKLPLNRLLLRMGVALNF